MKRFLPEHVSRYKDRHGKWRYRYRRKGHPGGHFTAEFGTDEWRAELAAFDAGGVQVSSPKRHAPGTIGHLILRYASTPIRLGPSAVTQGKVRAVLERFSLEHGHRQVADTQFEHIDKILERAAIKSTVQTAKGPRPVGGIHAARKLRKELVRLFDFAIKVRLIKVNPAAQAERIKQGPGKKKGFHSWTEAEIEQYRARHPLGTKPRLALELILWTGQRRSDAQMLGPDDIEDGRFVLEQGKTGKVLGLKVAQQLLEAIAAMPPLPEGAQTYLISQTGKTWTRASFGNAFRRWCDAAGLEHCAAHGLRKANARRMAELGHSNPALKAVGGWSRDEEVGIYTAAAEQKKLADRAIGDVSAWELSNRANDGSLTASQTPGKEG